MKLAFEKASFGDQVVERVFVGLNNESLNFLTSSAGLVRLIERASSDDCTVEEAAKLAQGEPLIAAKLVAMANSAAYNRAGVSVTSVRDALNLIGLGVLRAVASAVALRQLADSAPRANQPAVSRLWQHSVEVAALSAVIARRFTSASPDTAMFIGIVHEIAGFYLLSKSADVIDLTGSDVAGMVGRERASHDESANSILADGTRRLLAALQVPDEVVEAIEGQWRGFLMVPPESLTDTLVVAKLMAATASPFDPQAAGGEKTEATLDLEGVLQRSEVIAVLQQRYDEVRSIQQVLNQR
jgi:HD-like signal output (HDOD) protein